MRYGSLLSELLSIWFMSMSKAATYLKLYDYKEYMNIDSARHCQDRRYIQLSMTSNKNDNLNFSLRNSKIYQKQKLLKWLFSAPEPKAQVHYCDHASSVVNFLHFRLLLWNRWTEFNETREEARFNVLYQVCVFRADQKNKMAAWASDWLRHFRILLLNRWKEFNETWQKARSQRPLPSLCFSGRSEKQDGHPGLWLAETFFTSPLKPLNRIQRNVTGSKISTSSTKFVFFGPIRKTRWPPWPLIGWDIFYFSSETTEPNSTKLDRKQDLNVLYPGCVFRADRNNKMAALASDWQRHFWFLLWNRWTEFNETWQKARSQCPLQSLCFSDRSEKQDGRPGLWLAETFSTSPLKLLNGIKRNLTGSKISTSSTKFVFFGRISKQKCPPWPISPRGGTLYSGARYVALWASCLHTLFFRYQCISWRMMKLTYFVLCMYCFVLHIGIWSI